MKARPHAKIWGLTGGIASGKTTVAKYLEELGVPVIDADQVARRLSLVGGAAHEEIVQRFGTADRGKLRELVFQDPRARNDLESILHPHIQRESERDMQRLVNECGARSVIYEATLLVETGRYKNFDGLLVVESPRELRKQRLVARNGFSTEMADKILASQTSDEKRREAATIVIENSGSLEDLKKKILEFVLAARLISQ